MTDIMTHEQRSRCMSRIKSKNTSPELKLRRGLWREGIRGYRVNNKLPGKPDLVFSRQRLAIFMDGCFWHGCPLHSTMPKTNEAFWRDKIEKNMKRDVRATEELEGLGWEVLRFWEHEVKVDLEKCVAEVEKRLGRPNP